MGLLRRVVGVVRSELHARFDRSSDAQVQGGGESSHWRPEPRSEASLEQDESQRIRASYLANLELDAGASHAQIKAAYRRLMSKYHPDLHSQDPGRRATAEQITKRLNEAMAHFDDQHKHGETR